MQLQNINLALQRYYKLEFKTGNNIQGAYKDMENKISQIMDKVLGCFIEKKKIVLSSGQINFLTCLKVAVKNSRKMIMGINNNTWDYSQ